MEVKKEEIKIIYVDHPVRARSVTERRDGAYTSDEEGAEFRWVVRNRSGKEPR